MMQTLNPHSNTRTAEIMARYRPIAPKPDSSASSSPVSPTGDNSPTSPVPPSVRYSPYLMNVWPNLQARPTRTRKRGRTAAAPPSAAVKRSRTCLQGLSPSYQVTAETLGFVNDPNGIPQISFIPHLLPLKCGIDTPVPTPQFIPCAPVIIAGDKGCGGGIDLNKSADDSDELEFVAQFEGPSKSSAHVISPQPVRPIGSSITIGIITDESFAGASGKQAVKRPEEVEREVESEALPAVVSDSNNKVRIANSAYNEMVGQPECCWLDCMPCGRSGGGGGGNACKRIGGEVVLEFSGPVVPLTSNGFTCWVRIEWGNDGKRKVVNAFCDVIRLACDSKDYVFEWRFHLRERSECGSNV